MLEFSSISFSELDEEVCEERSGGDPGDLGELLERLGVTLESVRELSGVSTDLYRTMADLVRQSQQKLEESKRQNL